MKKGIFPPRKTRPRPARSWMVLIRGISFPKSRLEGGPRREEQEAPAPRNRDKKTEAEKILPPQARFSLNRNQTQRPRLPKANNRTWSRAKSHRPHEAQPTIKP